MPRKLPVFRGYTVDVRLREFRKLVYGKMPQFIPFTSPRGRKLIHAWSKTHTLEHDLMRGIADTD